MHDGDAREVALSGAFGETGGRFFQDRLEEHGIKLHGDDALERFEGADGQVTKVVTRERPRAGGRRRVVGAGVVPDVMLAKRAGLEIGESGGVVADSRLATSLPGVYVAGDMAEYDSVIHGRRLRVEHWDVAFNQGKTVALNMLGARPAPRRRALFLLGPVGLGVAGVRRPRQGAGIARSSAARSTTASSRSSISRRAAWRLRCRWGAPTT